LCACDRGGMRAGGGGALGGAGFVDGSRRAQEHTTSTSTTGRRWGHDGLDTPGGARGFCCRLRFPAIPGWALLSVGWWGGGGGGGGGGGASYPDKSDVSAAQAEWCKELAKIKGGAEWGEMGACKAAGVAASGPYLRKMTKCFFGRLAELGDKAPDHTQIVTDC